MYTHRFLIYYIYIHVLVSVSVSMKEFTYIHIDGLPKKRSPHVRNIWRISRLPHGVTSLWWPIATASKKKGTKSFTPTSVKHWHIDPVYIAQRTLIVNHSGIFDTPSIENIHTLCIINNTNSSLMPSTVASIHKVSLLQLSDRVNNGLY